MGNSIHRLDFSFTDSEWKNSLNVVTTNVESGEGTVILEVGKNDTINPRHVRSVETMIGDARHVGTMDERAAAWSDWIDHYYLPTNQPVKFCAFVVDFLVFVNVVLLLFNLFLFTYRSVKYNSKYEQGEDLRLPEPANFRGDVNGASRCDDCACETDSLPPVPPRSAKPKAKSDTKIDKDYVDLDMVDDFESFKNH